MLSGNCSAQGLVAADYATNPTYASGWSAGQNGGYGFGPWSFDGTNPTPPGQYQGMSSSSALGTAWTLATYDNHSGIADVGRAITQPGGLQPGQTLEVVIQNPLGYHFYRGWDICVYNGTNNNPGGVNTAAIRTQLFAYRKTAWDVMDYDGDTYTGLDLATTGASGMKYDLTLTSTNTYSLTLTPFSDPTNAYAQTGTLATNLPINWVNFRLYWGTSTGLSDTADNLEISSMIIAGPQLNIQQAGSNVVLSWSTNASGFYLESTSNLNAGAVWQTNYSVPYVTNGLYFVTNAITGSRQFYRLKQ
ncbi:MAG TPA: hypothetical protein VFB72_08630 [Verrucomicrobiae bacterium]|nr:hypothetical protein [Verrucomicrobiae bacterium]